jgi:hypothetical protein
VLVLTTRNDAVLRITDAPLEIECDAFVLARVTDKTNQAEVVYIGEISEAEIRAGAQRTLGLFDLTTYTILTRQLKREV